MTRWIPATVVMVVLVCSVWCDVLWAQALAPQQQSVLDAQIAPAYELGNAPVLINSINQLIANSDPAGIAGADRQLRETGKPALGEMLLEARVANMQRGGSFLEPKIQPKEVPLILVAFRGQVDELTDEIDSLTAMADELVQPAEISDYEDLFRSLQQTLARLDTAEKVVGQAPRLARLGARLKRSALNDEQREVLAADYGELTRKLQLLRRKTEEPDPLETTAN